MSVGKSVDSLLFTLPKIMAFSLAVFLLIILAVYFSYSAAYEKGVSDSDKIHEIASLRSRALYEKNIAILQDEISNLTNDAVNDAVKWLHSEEDTGEACRKLCADQLQPEHEYIEGAEIQGTSIEGLPDKEEELPPEGSQYFYPQTRAEEKAIKVLGL